ncbi:uncharacterized protein BDV14DRAFT_90336 [Aspergillus stella-maris]|uniref:uncharacterized protein n=1 Tax=Aspergillus stella-maris TaxID=1810926 RepID=UPI003CCD9C64
MTQSREQSSSPIRDPPSPISSLDSHRHGDIHIGATTCLLCRQRAGIESLIFESKFKKLKVLEHSLLECLDCTHRPSPKVWFHRNCLFLLKITYKGCRIPPVKRLALADPLGSPHFLDANEGLNVSVLQGLLSPWAAPLLSRTFDQRLLKRFPAEIQLAIAYFIGPSWYLITLGEPRSLLEELSRCDEEPQSPQIRLTDTVYVRWIIYRGQSYVSRISNNAFKTLGPSDQQCLKVPPTIHQIVLSLDTIGVRQIQFVGRDSKVQSNDSTWHEITDIPGPGIELDVRRNRLSLQGISPRQGRTLPWKPSTIWDVTDPPTVQPRNLFPSQESYEHSRHLEYVELGSHLNGLMVCLSEKKILGIHGLMKRSNALKFFTTVMEQKAPSLKKQWIFFPITAGEVIENIWVRHNGGANAQHLHLVIQTSLGRLATFGPQDPLGHRTDYTFRPLRQPGDGAISGIVHDSPDRIKCILCNIGVTCDPNIRVAHCAPSPPSEPPVPILSRPVPKDATWFQSKARLNGLISV